jgi:hypothetical protein
VRFFKLPPGVTLRFHSRFGRGILDSTGNLIEMNMGTGTHIRVFRPGQWVPEHILFPPNGLTILPGTGVTTTAAPRTLSHFVRQLARANPGQPLLIEWAACRSFLSRIGGPWGERFILGTILQGLGIRLDEEDKEK